MRNTVYVDQLEYKNVYDIDRLKEYNQYAERDIVKLQEAIEKVRKYQLELYEHVQIVLQTDIIKVVTLARRTEGYGNKTKIIYYVQLEYRPALKSFDSYRTIIKTEHGKKFAGVERHDAIRYAEQLAKPNRCKVEKIGRWTT
ncbi:hypothetical protein [Paenibacillus sp. Soil724D2]|uniref:hypothetical protein n=1 Tax=Paenibacillus sp. (strain Soil724D2) TaxID=1736392 RepID=UPI000715A789|nr:hypothetical protein [Paenibacillus sp. Soil724D2]KRE33281.1 hypothetical protein ASG85_13450 [Paenibacillus sp. Soil724D2]